MELGFLLILACVGGGIWFLSKVFSGASQTAASAPEPQQVKNPQNPSTNAAIRRAATRVAERNASEAGSYWDIAQEEADREGVDLWAVTDQVVKSGEAKDAREQAAYNRVRVVTRDFDGNDDVDLSGLRSVAIQVRGMGYWIDKSNLPRTGVCRLVREPRNRHDSNAIAAYLDERKIGYVSASKAESMSPLFDRIGKPAVIATTVSNGTFHLLLPALPELRKWVATNY